MLNLFIDAFFYRFQIIRVNNTFERIARVFPKLLHAAAVEDSEQGGICIEEFFGAVGAVNEKPSRHFIHKFCKFPGRLYFLAVRQQMASGSESFAVSTSILIRFIGILQYV